MSPKDTRHICQTTLKTNLITNLKYNYVIHHLQYHHFHHRCQCQHHLSLCPYPYFHSHYTNTFPSSSIHFFDIYTVDFRILFDIDTSIERSITDSGAGSKSGHY